MLQHRLINMRHDNQLTGLKIATVCSFINVMRGAKHQETEKSSYCFTATVIFFNCIIC